MRVVFLKVKLFVIWVVRKVVEYGGGIHFICGWGWLGMSKVKFYLICGSSKCVNTTMI